MKKKFTIFVVLLAGIIYTGYAQGVQWIYQQKQEKKSIAEIFADEGEEYFRKTETGIIDKLAELEPCIVSCGGGMAMREVNVEKMKKIGKVVLLTATPETIYSHVKDSTNRPLLNGNMNIPYIKKLMEERAPKYNAAADIVIETDGCTPSQVAVYRRTDQ